MSQVVGYDFTLKAEGLPHEKVIDFLKEWCKEWVFQLETGDDNGYLHYQGRCRLIKKRRPCELKLKWHKEMPGIHISPTTNDIYKEKEFSYVLKADTRKEGPWSSKEEAERKANTWQNQEFEQWGLLPWQEILVTMAKTRERRIIDVIYDPNGNIGKTSLCEYMWHHDIGMPVPPMVTSEDILQFVFGHQNKLAYLIDMPKAMKKERLAGFYAGIESLKGGFIYDKRYTGRCTYMNAPRVFIFTNTLPDRGLLSEDRWTIWSINHKNELVKYE